MLGEMVTGLQTTAPLATSIYLHVTVDYIWVNLDVAGGIHEVINVDSAHFHTPLNFSYSCSREQSMALQEKGEAEQTMSGVTLSLWSTQIQAYQLPADGHFTQSK